MMDDPKIGIRDAILCSGKGQLLREKRWALLSYGKTGELYDMENDPKQYNNLFAEPAYAHIVSEMQQKLKTKLLQIRNIEQK